MAGRVYGGGTVSGAMAGGGVGVGVGEVIVIIRAKVGGIIAGGVSFLFRYRGVRFFVERQLRGLRPLQAMVAS